MCYICQREREKETEMGREAETWGDREPEREGFFLETDRSIHLSQPTFLQKLQIL